MQHVDSGVISKIFNTDTFGLEQEENEEGFEEPMEAEPSHVQPTTHASDAVDYSDFNETVPDDQMFSDKYYMRGKSVIQTSSQVQSRLRFVSDDYDEEEEEKQAQIDVAKPMPIAPQTPADFALKPPVMLPSGTISVPSQPGPSTTTLETVITRKQADVKELFPSFEKGKILKFSDLFMTKLKRSAKLQPNKKGNVYLCVEYQRGN